MNSISFALAQLLIAGVNLYLLATIVNALLGWNIWVSTVVAAIIVLSYITLGGLSAAIYNEVLQFFVIVAALLPLTLLALHEVGGWNGLKDKMSAAGTSDQLDSWPGTTITTYSSSLLVGRRHRVRPRLRAVLRLLDDQLRRGAAGDGLQGHELRASAPRSSASFPKMFIPFIIIIPGMLAAVLVSPLASMKSVGKCHRHRRHHLQRLAAAADETAAAQRPARRRDRRPARGVHGRDGGQHLGVQHGDELRPLADLRPEGQARPLLHRRSAGSRRWSRPRLAIGTSYFASQFPNMMTYLQTLFGFFNAPLFATFILGMFWKRMTATAAWTGLVSGTLAAVLVAFLSEDAFGSASTGVLHIGGQGASFAGGRRGVRRRHRGQRGRHLHDRSPSRSRSCAGWSTRDAQGGPARRARGPLVAGAHQARRRLAGHGHRPQHASSARRRVA